MAKTSGGVRGNNFHKSRLRKVLKESEGIIRRNRYEGAIAFNSKGELLLNKKGGSRSVSFTQNEIRLLKDSIFTHNHPSSLGQKGIMAIGSSFSHQDLTMAVNANVKEIRAVTPTYTFSMRRPKNGWGTSTKSVKSAYDKASKAVRKEMDGYLKKMGYTQTAYNRANVSYWHQVNKRVAEKFGWDYSKHRG